MNSRLPPTLPVTAGNAPVTGSTNSFALQTGCYWNVQGANQTWITLPGTNSGTGNGSVSYTVGANACVTGRSGVIGVQAGTLTPISSALFPTAVFAVTQDGSNSNLALAPTGATVSSAAGTGTLRVTTGDGCSWGSFYSTVSWIGLTNPPFTTGAGNLTYNILANPGGARTGAIQIGPQTFTITQQGAPLPTPQVNAVLNAASYDVRAAAVSPGEIVALFGNNMGPANGVGLQLNPDGKSVSTSLGGAQVLFDGVAAPLTYAAATQVNAVVPFGVSGNTKIQVTYQGMTSPAVSMPVQAAAPGIFTLDGDGIGGGAILNQDFSINTNSNKAPRGSIVQIYCTGGGVTDPASVNGQLTAAANQLVLYEQQQVKVTIGGLDAAIKYAGGAPGAIAGALQINAVVPAGVTPGGNVPLTIQIGAWQSQANVTVAVQ